jgi:hypothetical protein
MGTRLRHVLTPETPIDADRRVQTLEIRVLGLMKAGHSTSLRRQPTPPLAP